jgi:hypothetical protein
LRSAAGATHRPSGSRSPIFQSIRLASRLATRAARASSPAERLAQVAHLDQTTVAAFVFARQDHVFTVDAQFFDEVAEPVDIAARADDQAPEQPRLGSGTVRVDRVLEQPERGGAIDLSEMTVDPRYDIFWNRQRLRLLFERDRDSRAIDFIADGTPFTRLHYALAPGSHR